MFKIKIVLLLDDVLGIRCMCELFQVGCTAFSVAALLYMVCEELLVSAHEEDDHVWCVIHCMSAGVRA